LDQRGGIYLIGSKGNYRIVDDEYGYGPCIVLEGEWSSAIAEVILKRGIQCVRFSYSMGWRGTALPVFSEALASQLRGVDVVSYDTVDLSALTAMPWLEKLSIHVKNCPGIDVAQFPDLKILFLSLGPNSPTSKLPRGLTHLHLDQFAGAYLSELNLPLSLTRLQITAKKLRDLDGLSACSNLETLELLDARSLTSINGLAGLPRLTTLVLDGAKGIERIDVLSRLPQLKSLELHNCGHIESLAPLASHPGLTGLKLTGTTTIGDLDLSLIPDFHRLETLQIQPRRGYSPKPAELFKQVWARRRD
jgi:Leucine-rich repeat (LRR) protein